MSAPEYAELIRELRAIPGAAPESVRERVRALGEPAPRWSIPQLPWRRSLLLLAPVCVLGVLVAAVVHGLVNSSAPKQEAFAHVTAGATGGAVHSSKKVFGAATDTTTPQVLRSSVLPPTSGRHQDYVAWIRVGVKDLDALTQQTNEAMQVVQSYGGYVASVNQSTNGGNGEADLVLRVPVAHVEDALVRLGALGTVLQRQLSIVDLEQTLRQQQQRILRLRLFIARASEELQQSLPADVRLRLQFALDQAKATLAQVTRANKGTLREAALSRISLTLTTEHAATAVKKGGVGRFHRAVTSAGHFLAGAGAVVLFLLIILSPVIVLVALTVLGMRVYRRREERRLLAA